MDKKFIKMNNKFFNLTLSKSWEYELKKISDLSSLKKPVNYVFKEISRNKEISPDINDIFKAFEYCSFSSTKVVIFGQDPYFQKGVANGLAFSVKSNESLPASLRNIYKEIKNDIGVVLSKNGSLDSWASQGVLLLNSCLTVEVSKPGSHSGAGWENFIKEVVLLLNKKNNLVFLLWGKNAKKYKKYINPNSHLVLTAPHPSPLSAYRGFFGCKHFSKCNAYLKANGIVEINW